MSLYVPPHTLLCKQLIYLLGVAGGDLVATQLQGRRHHAVLRRPLIVQEDERLDELEALALRLLPHLRERVHHALPKVVLLQQRRVAAVGADAVLGGKVHRLVLVRDRQGPDVVLVRVDHHTNAVVQHNRMVGVDRLERLEGDVLAHRVLREGLDAADDAHLVVLRDAPHVPGPEPALAVQHLRGQLGLLEVALEHERAAQADLTPRLGPVRVLVGVRVAQFDLLGDEHLPRTVRLNVAHTLNGPAAHRLRQAPANHHQAAHHIDELLRARGEGAAAAEHRPHPAAQGLPGLHKDTRVPVWRVLARTNRAQPALVGAVKHLTLEGARRRQLRLNRTPQRVEDARHADDEGGLVLGKVTVWACGEVGQRPRRAEADEHAAHEEDVHDAELEDVGQRQVGDVALLGDLLVHAVEPQLHDRDARRETTVAVHDPLWVARRPARVHDERNGVIVRGRLGGQRGAGGAAQLLEPLPRDDLARALLLARQDAAGGEAVEVDERARRHVARIDAAQQRGHALAVAHNRLALRLLEGVGQRVLAEVGVDGADDHVLQPDRVGRHEPLPPRLLVDGDDGACGQAQRRQAAAERLDVAPALPKAQVHPLLEVRHLHQLHLARRHRLLLLLHLLDGAVAEGDGVAALRAHRGELLRLRRRRRQLLPPPPDLLVGVVEPVAVDRRGGVGLGVRHRPAHRAIGLELLHKRVIHERVVVLRLHQRDDAVAHRAAVPDKATRQGVLVVGL